MWTAINVYSVRELEASTEAVVDRVADAGYDGIQFSGRHTPLDGDPGSIARQCEKRGLDVTPPHVGMERLEEDLDTVVEVYDRFGVEAAVIPSTDDEQFASAAAVDALAERVNALADDLAARGWELHYHNHAHEYTDLGGESAFDRFVDATGVGIELDVGWALVGGDDPARRIRELGERAELIHMKDMDTSVERGYVEIGDGSVDMAACAAAAADAGSEWLIYEHDMPEDPAGTIDHGAAYLNGLLDD
ncbi:MAG: sugar phosphate isomerase/epimerase family protein [Halobacteriaceae archaeon]